MNEQDKLINKTIFITAIIFALFTSLIWWRICPKCETPEQNECPEDNDPSYFTIGEAVSVDTGNKYIIVSYIYKGKTEYKLITKDKTNMSVNIIKGTKIKKINQIIIGLVLSTTMIGNTVLIEKQFAITKLF